MPDVNLANLSIAAAARTAARHSYRTQGPVRDSRYPHHRWRANSRAPYFDRRLHRGTKAARGQHYPARQTQHARVRLRCDNRQSALRGDAQFLGPGLQSRRLQWRFGRGSCRGSGVCGVVGLKPTYGRVSKAGVLPLSYRFDHAGPLTRTVEDAALHGTVQRYPLAGVIAALRI